MNRKAILSLLAVPISLVLLGAAVALGEENKPEEKAPEAVSAARKANPAKALQTALSSLTRATSYRARVEIEGGISDRADHEVTERTIQESYEGEVFGSLMHVPQVRAYRYPKKGVAYIDGAWKYILSSAKTLRLDRLFTFPEVILTRALALAPKNGRWLTAEEEKAWLDSHGALSLDDEQVEKDGNEEKETTAPGKSKKDEPKPASGKTVAQKAKAVAGSEGPPPRVLRVEAPPEEALKHWTEVQNSNCMGGG